MVPFIRSCGEIIWIRSEIIHVLISRERTCPRTYSGRISILESVWEECQLNVKSAMCTIHIRRASRRGLFLRLVIFESAQNRRWLLTWMSITAVRRSSLDWLPGSGGCEGAMTQSVPFYFDVLLCWPLMEQNGRLVYSAGQDLQLSLLHTLISARGTSFITR